MSYDRHERQRMRREKAQREGGLVPSPLLFANENAFIEIREWRSRKPFHDPAVSPPGRSLAEIQAAFRTMDVRDHQEARTPESELEFSFNDSGRGSVMQDAPSPTPPQFDTSKTYDRPTISMYVPMTVRNRILSAADMDWDQVSLAMYFETMTHLIDRNLIHSEVRTALHSKVTEDGAPATKCQVPQAKIDAHLAGEAETISHRHSAQIAGSIVQRVERMIAMDQRSLTEAPFLLSRSQSLGSRH